MRSVTRAALAAVLFAPGLALATPVYAQLIPAVGAPLPPRLGPWDFRYSQFTDSMTAEGPSDDRMGRYVQLQLRQRGRARTDSLDVRLYWEDKSAVRDGAFLGRATATAQAAAAKTVGAEGAPFKLGGPVYFVLDTGRASAPVTEVAFVMRGGTPIYRGWATLTPELLRRLADAHEVQVQAWDNKLGRFPFTAGMRAAALVALQIMGRAP